MSGQGSDPVAGPGPSPGLGLGAGPNPGSDPDPGPSRTPGKSLPETCPNLLKAAKAFWKPPKKFAIMQARVREQLLWKHVNGVWPF